MGANRFERVSQGLRAPAPAVSHDARTTRTASAVLRLADRAVATCPRLALLLENVPPDAH